MSVTQTVQVNELVFGIATPATSPTYPGSPDVHEYASPSAQCGSQDPLVPVGGEDIHQKDNAQATNLASEDRGVQDFQPAVLLDMAIKIGEQSEKLASHFERSKVPYSDRKAAKIRRERNMLITMTENLLRCHNAKVEQEARPDYAAIAEELQQRGSRADEADATGSVEHEDISDPKDKAAQPQAQNNTAESAEAGLKRVNSGIDLGLVQPSTATSGAPFVDKIHEVHGLTVQDLLHIQPSRQQPTSPCLEAQDIALSSRIASCAMILFHAGRVADATKLAQFGVDLCGEAVWKDRMGHYLESSNAELQDCGFVRVILNEAVLNVARFDEAKADELERIMDGIQPE